MKSWFLWWIRTAVLIALAVAVAGCDGIDPQSETERIFAAQIDADQGDFRTAQITLKGLLQDNPRNASARVLLGEIYIKLGLGAAAEKEILRAQDLGVPAAALAVNLADAFLLQGKFDAVTVLAWPMDVDAAEQARFAARQADALISLGSLERARELLAKSDDLFPGSADVLTTRARLLIATRDYEVARTLLDDLIAKNPGHGPAWSLSGDLALLEDNEERSIVDFRKAVDKQTNKFPDLLKLGKVLVRRGDYEEAEKIVSVLEKRAATHPEVLLLRGTLQLAAGEDDPAFATFAESLKQNPQNALASFYLGRLYLQQGNRELAMQHLQQAVNLRPTLGAARRAVGVLQMDQGNAPLAIEMLAPVVKAAPDDVVAANSLAAAYLQTGRALPAVEILERIAASHPESAMARFRLSSALLAAGERDAGVAQLQAALEIAPDLPAAHIFLVTHAGRDPEVLRQVTGMLQSLASDYPGSTMVLNTLGAVYLLSADIEGARRAYSASLGIDPDNVTARMNLAGIQMNSGDIAGAEALYDAVLSSDASNLTALVKLAEIHAARGDVGRFEELLATAVRKNPDSLEPRLILARHEISAGRSDKAIELLEPLSDSHPDNAELLLLLGTSEMATGSTSSALPKLERAALLAPRSDRAAFMLARAYALTERPSRFRSSLARTLEINPQHVEAGKALARLQITDLDFDAAELTIARVREIAPDDAELASLQALLQSQRGDPQVALRLRREAFEAAPNTSRMLALAHQLWRTDAKLEALDILQDWADRNPRDIAARLQLAKTYLLLDRAEDAEKEYAAVLSYDADNAVALNDMAMLLVDRNAGQALELAERAAAAAPDSASVMDTQSRALAALGEHRKALRLAERAAAQEPGDKGYLYQLAVRSVAAGDTARARAILEELLASTDGFPERDDAEALLNQLPEGE